MTIQNDNMSDQPFYYFLCDSFNAMDKNLKTGGAFYIWHADSNGDIFRNACVETGWKVRQCLIWKKNHLVLGRQDYQWMHEPCLYGWKEGAGHYFIDKRNQTTIIEDAGSLDVNKLKKDEMRELLKKILNPQIPVTVIEENAPLKNDLHPTMKPVALIGRLIRNSSKEGDIVLDGFGGSGTTIIAAEQLNRKAYVMELDEHYCDVILARWEKMTGKTAKKIC